MEEDKEGCKSWFLAFACSAIYCLTMCPYRLSGLLFVALLEQYNTDREKASMPIFMCFLMFGLTGPLSGWMGQKIGVERTTMLGCLIAAVGIGMTYFALNITFAIISIGFIYGLGMTVSITLIPNILKKHFTKNYNTASGISLAGPCLGALIFPAIAIYMMNVYGVSGTFLIIGAIMLHGVPISMLLCITGKSKIDHQKRINKVNTVEECLLESKIQSQNRFENINFSKDAKIIDTTYRRIDNGSFDVIRRMKKENTVEETRPLDPNNEETKHCLPETNMYIVNDFENQKFPKDTTNGVMNIKNPAMNYDSSNAYETKYKEINKHPCNEQKPEALSRTKSQTGERSSFDLYRHLLTNPTFLVYMTLVSLHIYIASVVWTTIIDYSRDKRIDKSYEMYLLMFPSLMDLIGRLSLVWIIDKKYMSSSLFSITTNLMLAFACGMIIISTNISTLMSGSLLFGLGSGALLATYPGQVFEFLEKDFYIVAMASKTLLYVPLSFTASPLIEYFRNDLLSYDGLYYVVIGICLLSCCITPLMSRLSIVKKEKLKAAKEIVKTDSSEQTV